MAGDENELGTKFPYVPSLFGNITGGGGLNVRDLIGFSVGRGGELEELTAFNS